jgi:hypothetical protein
LLSKLWLFQAQAGLWLNKTPLLNKPACWMNFLLDCMIEVILPPI